MPLSPPAALPKVNSFSYCFRRATIASFSMAVYISSLFLKGPFWMTFVATVGERHAAESEQLRAESEQFRIESERTKAESERVKAESERRIEQFKAEATKLRRRLDDSSQQ